MFESLSLQMCLASSHLFGVSIMVRFLNEDLWFENLSLKVVDVRPVYVSVSFDTFSVTVAS